MFDEFFPTQARKNGEIAYNESLRSVVAAGFYPSAGFRAGPEKLEICSVNF